MYILESDLWKNDDCIQRSLVSILSNYFILKVLVKYSELFVCRSSEEKVKENKFVRLLALLKLLRHKVKSKVHFEENYS